MAGLKGKKETLQIMWKDGSLDVDPGAVKVASQMVSDPLGGLTLPVREPTDTYVHKELNRAPSKRSSVIFETADPIAPDFDSQFVLRDAPNIWEAAREGLDTEINSSRRFNQILQGIAVVVSSLCLIAALGVAFSASEHAAAPTEPAPRAQPTAAPILPAVR